MSRLVRAALDFLACLGLGVAAGGLGGAGFAVAFLTLVGGIGGIRLSDLGFATLTGAFFGAAGGADTGLVGGTCVLVVGRGRSGVLGWGLGGLIGGIVSWGFDSGIPIIDFSSGLTWLTGVIGGLVGLGIGWKLSRPPRKRLPVPDVTWNTPVSRDTSA